MVAFVHDIEYNVNLDVQCLFYLTVLSACQYMISVFIAVPQLSQNFQASSYQDMLFPRPGHVLYGSTRQCDGLAATSMAWGVLIRGTLTNI